ncbi:hypothetical protein A3759_10740 [Thalassolituus sp. HI0120]|nr:hypothetical protein A3759_22965 [Thalassolituus sp. HI0120]KZZ45078.1 hypothetical protein A3759_10740 [Thalassolituus sp. HI0120]
MANQRIIKKRHTIYLGEFLVDASQDKSWKKKLQELKIEDKLNTSEIGFPSDFNAFFPETVGMELQYCIERVNLEDVPRAASCWWPVDEATHFYMAYPAGFPQTSIFMAIDFEEHSDCCA